MCGALSWRGSPQHSRVSCYIFLTSTSLVVKCIMSIPAIIPLEHPRQSLCTRLLHSILPASCYAKNDKSIDGIHAAISEELTELFETGIRVQVARCLYNIGKACFSLCPELIMYRSCNPNPSSNPPNIRNTPPNPSLSLSLLRSRASLVMSKKLFSSSPLWR